MVTPLELVTHAMKEEITPLELVNGIGQTFQLKKYVQLI